MYRAEDKSLPIKTAANLALDYIRWTQLVPMITGWAFALILLLGMSLIAFEGEIDFLLERLEPAAERILGPAPEPDADPDTEQASIHFTDEDVMPWILRGWGMFAFLGWLTGLIRSKFRGPRKPMPLKRKFLLVLTACSALAVLVIILYLLTGDFSANRPGEMIIAFTLPPILLFMVSAWGLGVSHLVDKVQAAITDAGIPQGKTEQKTGTEETSEQKPG